MLRPKLSSCCSATKVLKLLCLTTLIAVAGQVVVAWCIAHWEHCHSTQLHGTDHEWHRSGWIADVPPSSLSTPVHTNACITRGRTIVWQSDDTTGRIGSFTRLRVSLYGVPWRSMYVTRAIDSANVWWPNSGTVWTSSTLTGRVEQRLRHLVPAHLPLRLQWSGFIANQVLYVGGICAATLLWRRIVRGYRLACVGRRRLPQCLACGYPIAVAGVQRCAECGGHIDCECRNAVECTKSGGHGEPVG